MTAQPRPGQRVTWNETGKRLFGDTGSVGLLVDVAHGPGHDGPAGHILWESGQETWASMDCLEAVDEVSP